MSQLYTTDELELAAFLKATGHRLLGLNPTGRLVSFSFEASASSDVEKYFSGAEISGRDLFEAHRHLRTLIRQVKEQNHNQIGSEQYDKYLGNTAYLPPSN
jgi:hypothetical protein